MTFAGTRTGLALLAVVVASSGCYRYVPSSADLAPPGEDVRILVTRVGAAQLTQVSPGAAATGTVAGRLEGIEGDDLLLSVPVGERREGFMTYDLTQTIRVPRGEILNLDRREFDRAGTAFIGVAAAAVGTGIIVGIMKGFGGTGGPDDPPPPEDFTFTLGRFSFPFGW